MKKITPPQAETQFLGKNGGTPSAKWPKIQPISSNIRHSNVCTMSSIIDKPQLKPKVQAKSKAKAKAEAKALAEVVYIITKCPVPMLCRAEKISTASTISQIDLQFSG